MRFAVEEGRRVLCGYCTLRMALCLIGITNRISGTYLSVLKLIWPRRVTVYSGECFCRRIYLFSLSQSCVMCRSQCVYVSCEDEPRLAVSQSELWRYRRRHLEQPGSPFVFSFSAFWVHWIPRTGGVLMNHIRNPCSTVCRCAEKFSSKTVLKWLFKKKKKRLQMNS